MSAFFYRKQGRLKTGEEDAEPEKTRFSGAFWNMMGSTMFGANSFVMLALVSRVASIEQVGHFGIAFTTAQILFTVALFGVSQFQMTDYSGQYRFQDYRKVRIASCLFASFCCGLILLLPSVFGEKARYLALLTFLMMLNAYADLYQCLFFQKNRLDLSGSALFFRTSWSLVVFSVLLPLTKRVDLAIGVQALANLLLTLYYIYIVAPQFISVEEAPSEKKAAFSLISQCFPLFVSIILMNLLLNISKYGIEFLLDDAAQGYFNIIMMPAQAINLCSQFLFKPFLKRYFVLLSTGKTWELKRLLWKQISVIVLFTVLCCLCAFAIGPEALTFVFQKDVLFLRGAFVLIIFGGGVFALCTLFYYLLVLFRAQKQIMRLYLLVTALAPLVVFTLIRLGGITGAAWAFVVTQLMLQISYPLILGKEMRRMENG